MSMFVTKTSDGHDGVCVPGQHKTQSQAGPGQTLLVDEQAWNPGWIGFVQMT